MVKSDSCFLKQFDNKLSIKNKNTMKEKKSKKNQPARISEKSGVSECGIGRTFGVQ